MTFRIGENETEIDFVLIIKKTAPQYSGGNPWRV